MNIKILRQVQEYIFSLKDDIGNWRDKPIGIIGKANTSDKGIERIKTIINILLSSDKLSDDSKIYISTYGISISSTNKVLNDLNSRPRASKPKIVSYNTTVARINNDENALKTCIGENFLRDIVYDAGISDKEFNNKLAKILKDYGVFEKQRSNLQLFIDDSVIDCNGYENSEDFFEILQSLEVYLVQRKHIIEDTINSDKQFIGYFNYLLSAKGMQDEKISRDRERLMKFLRNEDYITGYTNNNEGLSILSLLDDEA